MRHWILSRMIHCPCENELVYLPEKTVMLEEKYLLGKYKYKFTVMNEAETMKPHRIFGPSTSSLCPQELFKATRLCLLSPQLKP